MENTDQITVEAEVHEQTGTRRSGRTTTNSAPVPPEIPAPKTTKKRGPKPKTNTGETSKRMTINGLANIVSERQMIPESIFWKGRPEKIRPY